MDKRLRQTNTKGEWCIYYYISWVFFYFEFVCLFFFKLQLITSLPHTWVNMPFLPYCYFCSVKLQMTVKQQVTRSNVVACGLKPMHVFCVFCGNVLWHTRGGPTGGRISHKTWMQRRGVMFTGRRHRNTQGCGRFCQTWSWKNEKPVFPPWVDKRSPSPTSRTPHTQHSHTHA